MLESFCLTTILLFITWAIIITTLTSCGFLIQRIYGISRVNGLSLIVSFWIGFAAFIGVSQIWNIFLPADGWVWLVFNATALISFFWNKKVIQIWMKSLLPRKMQLLFFLGLTLILALEIAYFAANSIPVHDTGSYHLPATLWNHAFPVVPGLSNLHSRLGFNSSLFVYSATLSEFIWTNRPHHIVMAPFILMMYGISFLGLSRLIFKNETRSYSAWFELILVLPIYYVYHWWNHSASISPNGMVFLLILTGIWVLIRGLENAEKTPKDQYLIVIALLILVTAVSVKLTIAPFVLIICLFLFGYFGRLKSVFLKPLLWVIIGSIVIIGPWLIRGAILSGYPLYPINIAALDVDWRVPTIQAELDAGWTKSYSRVSYEEPPSSLSWTKVWALNLFKGGDKKYGILLPFVLAISASFISLLSFIFVKSLRTLFPMKYVFWIGTIIVISLFIWFFTAPDPRFGMGLFWLLACITIALVLFQLFQSNFHFIQLIVVFIIAGLFTMGLYNSIHNLVIEINTSHKRNIPFKQKRSFYDILNDGLSELPATNFWEFSTTSGLVLSVPENGNQIWNTTLLSSPHPSPGLMLRDATNLSNGFKCEGEWRPYGYPILKYDWHLYVKKRLDEYYSNTKEEFR